ncbi:hypothetical protein [Flaviaesturariibacter aridisoli]|uniref:DUF4138 domain-containing protein n=1 Tax=Flaviaesturariibacter aridisoli TaxID=2545761 RepID=A0A4R4E3H6_9BACT|nr:hypothetical protein [Flaviaesturariibacter aridisoli]TCZ74066.1 hypothetical protein E0486_03040 [Flaviaesturariibacter aridisoli]
MKYITIMTMYVLLLVNQIFAQDYQVTKVNGKVYNGNKMLVKDDWINGVDKLTANSVSAAIRLVSTKYGVVVMSFVNGKKTINQGQIEKSEIYELVVQDYVDNFIRHKQTGVMGAPGEFDWYTYFYEYSDSLPHRMLVVEGEKIPFQSRVFPKTSRPFKIFMNISTKSDSASYELPIEQDSICFPRIAFSGDNVLDMQIDLAFTDKHGLSKTTRVTRQPIEVYYLTRPQLNSLIFLFSDNADMGYKTSLDAKSDLYFYLDFNFTKFYHPLVETQVNSVFK